MSTSIVERYLAAYQAKAAEAKAENERKTKEIEDSEAQVRLGIEQRGAALLRQLLPELVNEIGLTAAAYDPPEKMVTFCTNVVGFFFDYSEFFTSEKQLLVWANGHDGRCKIYPNVKNVEVYIGACLLTAKKHQESVKARFEEDQREIAETQRRVALQEACWPEGVVLSAYKLTYAELAIDDDGEKYVERQHLYTLDDVANYDGFWAVFKNGQPRSMKIFSATTLERIDFSRGDAVWRHFAVPFKVGEDTVWRPVDEWLRGKDPQLFPGLPKELFEPLDEIPF